MRDLVARLGAGWRRSARRPAFDGLALTYSQRCDCVTYPLCPDTTDRERAYIAADMADSPEGLRRISDAVAQSNLRWRNTLAVFEQRAERWERLAMYDGPTAGSYAEAAHELRTLLAAMREGAPR